MEENNTIKVKCPHCGQDYFVENAAGILDMNAICQKCNTNFLIKDNLIEEDFAAGNNTVTDNESDNEADKTIPPKRMPKRDISERTMPGFRERNVDGRFMVGDLIMGRYKVLAELGQGGMGVVYKCFDETGGIEIALKSLPPELSHSTLEMEDIKENFQLVSKLIHQNIAVSKNLEKDSSNGNYYLIMECVEGEDLRRWIKRKRKEGTLTLEMVLPVIRQVAEALDYAHEEKIIHRDIKPGNIMINYNGHVKVLDFGLAAQIHSSMTRASMAYHGTSGTGPYMAPEQWRGRAQGAPADQYALAVMVYEMLAGHLPFDSTDAIALREAVLNETVDAIKGYSSAINRAFQRAMSKEPAERFDSCTDFVEALGGKKFNAIKKASGGKSKYAWVAILTVLLLSGAVCLSYGVYQYKEKQIKEKQIKKKQIKEKQIKEEFTELAKEYYQKKNYIEAFQYSMKADLTDSIIQFQLGYMYANGQGVARDYTEAVNWYRKSAEQGDADAQCNLGVMYENGQGVARDYTEAVNWYRKSAEQGNAVAQKNLGVMYYTGRGVARDYKAAVNWYRKSAKQGDADAKKALQRLRRR